MSTTESKCPIKHTAGGGTTNRDWWPKELKLELLAQHSSKSNIDSARSIFSRSEFDNALELKTSCFIRLRRKRW